MNDLDRLYQQTILDYNNRKDLKYEIPDATYIERGHNPSCGDDITLFLKIVNNKIVDISFLGNACAICTASTVMLIENTKDKKIDDTKYMLNVFFDMMRKENNFNDYENILKDASILEFVADMPARIKCATLSWHSLNVIVDNEIKKL